MLTNARSVGLATHSLVFLNLPFHNKYKIFSPAITVPMLPFLFFSPVCFFFLVVAKPPNCFQRIMQKKTGETFYKSRQTVFIEKISFPPDDLYLQFLWLKATHSGKKLPTVRQLRRSSGIFYVVIDSFLIAYEIDVNIKFISFCENLGSSNALF